MIVRANARTESPISIDDIRMRSRPRARAPRFARKTKNRFGSRFRFPRPADGRETRRVPYRESESRDACVKPQTHPMGVEMGASVQAVSVALRFIRLRLNAHLPYALYAV